MNGRPETQSPAVSGESRRKPSLPLRILLATFAAIVAFAVFEVALRIVDPDWSATAQERDFFCEYDSELGWRQRPGAEGILAGPDFRIAVRISRGGFRDADVPPGPARGRRIVVLGDSFAWGYGVAASNRFTEILERRLPGIDLLNMACSGYGQDQELLLLQRSVFDYQPDAVWVLVHFDSDIGNNMTSVAYGYEKPVFVEEDGDLELKNVPVPKMRRGNRLAIWLNRHSAVWKRVRQIHVGGWLLEMRLVALVNALTGDTGSGTIRSNVAPESLMAALLGRMAYVCSDHGAQFLVILAPNVRAGSSTLIPDARMPAVVRELGDEGIPFAELTPIFESFAASEPGAAVTFENNRHWNEQGHAIVADYLMSLPAAIDAGAYAPANARREVVP